MEEFIFLVGTTELKQLRRDLDFRVLFHPCGCMWYLNDALDCGSTIGDKVNKSSTLIVKVAAKSWLTSLSGRTSWYLLCICMEQLNSQRHWIHLWSTWYCTLFRIDNARWTRQLTSDRSAALYEILRISTWRQDSSALDKPWLEMSDVPVPVPVCNGFSFQQLAMFQGNERSIHWAEVHPFSLVVSYWVYILFMMSVPPSGSTPGSFQMLTSLFNFCVSYLRWLLMAADC